MSIQEQEPFAHAMAFYHPDGLVAAWNHSAEFAGENGRLATMPDIVAARIKSGEHDVAWDNYFTTVSAEYLGFSRAGHRILIVAHGVGPMSTLEGAQKAYSWEYKDKSRRRRGGRISEQEFRDLEEGKFGEVEIVDLHEYCKLYEYPFMEILSLRQALDDPLLRARLGPQAEAYLQVHASIARNWYERHGEQPKPDPYIVQMEAAANCPYTLGHRYGHKKIEDGYAIGHLLSTGRLTHLGHNGLHSLTADVSCHEWWNGTRMIGIKRGGRIQSGLNAGPNAHALLRKHWRNLLIPSDVETEEGLYALVKIDDQWFTQYPKRGKTSDTFEPMHVVTELEELGEPVEFRTTVEHYHGFFKFALNEVTALAPKGANAYAIVSEPQNEWNDGNPTHQTCLMQFYRVEVDTSSHLIRSSDLVRDFGKLMELIEKDSQAS